MSDEQPLDLSVGPRAKRQQFKPTFNVTLLNREPEIRQPNCQRLVKSCTYNVQHNLHASVNLITVQQEIATLYQRMLEPLIAEAGPEDLISVVLRHEGLIDGDFYMEYQKKKNITYQELGRAFHLLLQSNTRFLLDGNLTLVVACITPVTGGSDDFVNLNQKRGGGRGNSKQVRDLETHFHKSTSLVTVRAGKTACGYYALGFGVYRAEHGLSIEDFKRQWKSLVTNLSVQRNQFEAIWRKYGIRVNYDVKMNEDILKAIQLKLRDVYKIVVIRRPTKIPYYGLITKVFEGESNATEIIYLEFVPGETMDDGHYNYIKTPGAYHGAEGYCIHCCHTHSKVGAHFCSAICRSCGKGECSQVESVECEACKVVCRSTTCLEVHQAKQCKKFKYCATCESRYTPVKGYEHKCDERYCNRCKMAYTSGHHHYLVPADKDKLREEDMKTKIIVAYDIEAAQVRETEKTARHEANLLIAHVICDNCWDFNGKQPIECSDCGQHEYVFRGSDCVKNFADFLINVISKRAGKAQPVDIYAHNAKNYDSRFVLRELLRRKLVDIELIMQGSKITKMKASNLRFVDSCAHFQQKLSKLPKSFAFADKVVKGYFPHLLNDGRDWNQYPRELPAPHYFGVDTMQDEDRKGFEKWYAERSLTETPWVFEEEIVKYCRNDVEVLLTAVQVYRKQMVEITGMDPTTRKFTLPGVTHEVFAANMLKPRAIGITPISNYAGRKQSYQGKAWLDAMEVFVVGHRLEREKAVGPYYADAYDPATNTVYEYWGCLWHGCPCAYGDLEERDLKGRKLVKTDLLKAKNEKLEYYKRRGFNIVEEKECVFTRQIYKPTAHELENESLESCRRREFCINRIMFYRQLHDGKNRCNVRDSFFGGRTGNASLFYECSEEEELKYYDFTSLYPHVLSAEPYPVGHPVEVNGNIDGSGEAFEGVLAKKYFGFVSCTVVPPHRARFGILPMRHDGKLVFPLCYSCTTTGDTGDCPHEDCDRALNQTWSTPELYKALEHGYRLLKVHHVLHYEKKDDQMFKEYIRMWLKIKQEASGWPAEVERARREQGEEAAVVAQQQYIQSYYAKEGILLDESQICHNPGRRQIAKLMLNSFWGKFAQRPNLPQTAVITDYAQFRKLHDNPKYRIVGEHETGLDSFIVNYVETNEDECDPGKTSIAIASFVTSYARLKLYDLMRKVEYELPNIGRPRTLYYDTDSIIFIARKDDGMEIPLGNYLGELTDEIAGAYGHTAYCKQAAFLGPKNYAYEIRFTDKPDRVTNVKCKGITLYSSDLNIFREFSKVLDLAKTAHATGLQQEATFYQSGIRANVDNHQLRTVNFEKTIKTRLDKRRYLPLLGYSVPIGFKQFGAPQAPTQGPPTSMTELIELYFTNT